MTDTEVIMRKTIFLTAALCAVAGTALLAPAGFTAKAAEPKQADVYILAGQSNAAGYSNIKQQVYGNTSVTYEQQIGQDDARNGTGYSNVLYFGTADIAASATMPTLALQPTKIGLGRNTNYMGPELGMAKELSGSYTDENPAVIVKYAFGGTYLGDYAGTKNETKNAGNWASPSLTAKWKSEGKTVHQYNGLCYERLLKVTGDAFTALRAQGYTPSVKGYIWMQGEADAGDPLLANAYEENLTLFINDLRADVAELAEDDDAANRPFVIGKICSSGWFGNNISTVRAAEDAVAAKLPYVYLFDTDEFKIHNDDGTANGSDDWHFNAGDAYLLGQRFAQTATANLAKYTYSITAGSGGTASKNVYLSDGEAITIGYTAQRGKKLAQVLLNEADVTADCVQNGEIRITPEAASPAFNNVELVFGDAAAYTLTVSLSGKGKITRSLSGSRVYEGDVLVVEALPAEGHEVDKVLCNNAEVTAGADGKYTVTISGNTVLAVSFKEKAQSGDPSGETGTTGQRGCSGAIGASLGAFGAVALGAAVLSVKKKRG